MSHLAESEQVKTMPKYLMAAAAETTPESLPVSGSRWTAVAKAWRRERQKDLARARHARELLARLRKEKRDRRAEQEKTAIAKKTDAGSGQ